MEDNGKTESQTVVEELVLRGKVPGRFSIAEQDGVIIRVLWGKYREEQGRTYEGFGLLMEDGDGMIRRIPNLSTDAGEVYQLAERMNRYKVSRYHVDDVVADFLAAV